MLVSDENSEKLTMTIPQAASLLGISRNAGYKAARRGELPTLVIGRRILVPKAAFMRMLAEVKGGRQPQSRDRSQGNNCR